MVKIGESNQEPFGLETKQQIVICGGTIPNTRDAVFSFHCVVADISTGRVGSPLICCEIRLRDWAEGKEKMHKGSHDGSHDHRTHCMP